MTERERVRAQSREQTAQNIHVYTEHYEKERIYVRQVGSMRYSLAAERRERLSSVPRIIQTRLGDGLHEN